MSADEDPGSSATRRYLVIANKTLASARLRAEIAARVAAGPSEIHLLVPQTPSPTGQMADIPEMGPVMVVTDADRARARQDATERLERMTRELADLGCPLTGEIATTDPFEAARTAFERSRFDEIILSTLPAGLSRWLKLDLPSRFERAFDVPVTALIADDDPTADS